MADQHNSVTIFSNGQANLRQYVKVAAGKETELSLPFRQSSMEDVLASFGVYSPNVKYVRPPSYTLPTKKTTINLGATTFDTMASLRGAKIKFQRAGQEITGIIFGTDTLQEVIAVGGGIANTRYLTVQTDKGLVTVPWKEVTEIAFTEKEIVAEIDKALTASRQRLKPDSVFLQVALKTKPPQGAQDTDQQAILQWVEQLVPWQVAYRLTRKEDGKGYLFDIFGIAHNPTDTDWTNYIITLVNGKPMTFISDLDQQKNVERSRVNIADTIAKGGMIPETGFTDDEGGLEAAAGGGGGPVAKAARLLSTRSMGAVPSMAPAAAPQAASLSNYMGSELMGRGQASFPAKVVTEDVGDYCMYRQESPMTIASNSAAAIPLYSTEVSDAKQVLVFDSRYSQIRPFRAVLFKNETKQGLGIGVCVVFEKGLFQGKCVMQSSKPGESRMLFYAEETGVHVTAKTHTAETLPRRLKVHEGSIISTVLQKSRTTYVLRNVKDEAFEILVEYQRLLNQASTISCDGGKKAEELQNGARYSITLPAKGNVTITVSEEYTGQQSLEMSDANWFLNTFIAGDANLGADKSIKAIVSQNEKLGKKTQEIAICQGKIQKATQNKNHFLQIVQTGQNAGNLEVYQKDLLAATTTMKEEGEKLEKLQEEHMGLQEKLYELLQKLSGEWAYKGNDEKNEDPQEPAQ